MSHLCRVAAGADGAIGQTCRYHGWMDGRGGGSSRCSRAPDTVNAPPPTSHRCTVVLGRKRLIAEEFALWRESSFSGSCFFSFQALRRKFHSSSLWSCLSSFSVIGFRPSRACLHHLLISVVCGRQETAAVRGLQEILPVGGCRSWETVM